MAETDRVNGLIGTLGIKAPVRAATVANVTLSGEQTVDGVSLLAGERVLVKDQTDPVENGIYYVETGAWTRAPDFDGTRDVVTGTSVPVNSGTVNGLTRWLVSTTGSIVPGTSSLSFVVDPSGTDVGGQIHGAPSKAVPADADELTFVDSAASWVLKKMTFANLAALCSAGWNAFTATTAVLAATATVANRVDSGQVTVASAASPDIFGAAANTIDYTGTTTATGFTAAPKAGMERKLICSGACAFTAGANLTIAGFASGETATMAAGAEVIVRAITTTTFSLSYVIRGSFTLTGVGFSGSVTETARYLVQNGKVDLQIRNLSGTSNSTAFTMTGAPTAIIPLTASARRHYAYFAYDNSVETRAELNLNNSGTISCVKIPGTTWTAANLKGVENVMWSYRVNYS